MGGFITILHSEKADALMDEILAQPLPPEVDQVLHIVTIFLLVILHSEKADALMDEILAQPLPPEVDQGNNFNLSMMSTGIHYSIPNKWGSSTELANGEGFWRIANFFSVVLFIVLFIAIRIVFFNPTL